MPSYALTDLYTTPFAPPPAYHQLSHLPSRQPTETVSEGVEDFEMEPEEVRVKRTYRALATGTEKIYMAIAAFEAFVVFCIAFTVFGLVEATIKEQNSKTRTVPVYLAVFIFAQIFSLLYVFDGLRGRNIVQLCLHLFFNVCILVYSILQIPQTKDALDSAPQDACGSYQRCTGPHSFFNLLRKLFIVTPIVLGLSTIAFAALIRRLHVQFGWAVFHLVGASPRMKRMHREYQTLISLLKLLLFFAMAFCIAYLILDTRGIHRNTPEFVLTIIALPVVPILMLACGWALRAENKPIMGLSLGVMIVGLGYFVYKLASMFLPRTSWLYVNTRVTLAMFSIFSIIILIVTFIYGCICMSNFGKGLVEAHRNPENRTSLWGLPQQMKFQEKMKAQQEGAGGPMMSPMIID
ncbi:hypothetical protein M231_06816 [Tremella mesenterica]|uniref:Uncharacterized protein n=1 Tax=Tremella mesenterica TaxID=5217 RepID=A0A4Q1BD99_TREME|nr:hypothetical protein M231_06816 [Tremella mesenterica]